MTGHELEVPVPGGHLAGIDFGGHGPEVLLVHGTGHNAAVWGDVAGEVEQHCHAVAIDLRGHGQSSAASGDAEQYWRDLALVVEALGWTHPVLVGHSTGGYAVTAATAAGLVGAAAICVVDGFVLDDRTTAATAHAAMRAPEALDELRTRMQYGWTGDDQEMERLVDTWVREASDDWLNAGARAALVKEVGRRSLRRHGTGWLRHPTLDEITAVSSPEVTAAIFPSVDVYDRLDVPATMVLAGNGLYAARRDEVAAVVAAGPRRRLVEVESNHNVPMTAPGPLARILLDAVPG